MSQGNIQAQIGAFLYAIGIVNDDEDIIKISFGDMSKDIVPIKVEIKKRLEVQITKYNGGKKEERLPERV